MALDPLCSLAQYDAATPDQQRAHDLYWLACWQARNCVKLDDELLFSGNNRQRCDAIET